MTDDVFYGVWWIARCFTQSPV